MFDGNFRELIRQVNLLPPYFQLKSFDIEMLDQRQLIREQTGDKHAAPSITNILNVCLEGTPEEFRQHIEYETMMHVDPFGIAKLGMVNTYNIQTKAGIYIEYFAMRSSK